MISEAELDDELERLSSEARRLGHIDWNLEDGQPPRDYHRDYHRDSQPGEIFPDEQDSDQIDLVCNSSGGIKDRQHNVHDSATGVANPVQGGAPGKPNGMISHRKASRELPSPSCYSHPRLI